MIHQGFNSPLYHKAYEGTILPAGFLGCDLIKRPIEGTEYFDLSNIYPFIHPQIEDKRTHPAYDMSQLQSFNQDCVGLTLITSPFMNSANLTDGQVNAPKWDRIRRYKPHYIVDFSSPLTIKGENYNQVRKFAKLGGSVRTETLFNHNYIDHARTFHKGYTYLIKKRKAEGTFSDFSERAITHFFSAPGAIVFKAYYKDRVIAQILTYVMGDIGHYFLASTSHKSYGIGANFALQYEAIMFFKQMGLRFYSLGGANDNAPNSQTLASYKESWSNSKKDSYILHKVFNQGVYKELIKGHDPTYLPPYRRNED